MNHTPVEWGLGWLILYECHSVFLQDFNKIFEKNSIAFCAMGVLPDFDGENHLPHFIIKEIFQFLHFCLNAALYSICLCSLMIS